MNAEVFLDYIERCNWDVDLVSELLGIESFNLRYWLEGYVEPNKAILQRVAEWIGNKLQIDNEEVFKQITGGNNE